jgi:hypothetical protein
MAAYLGMPRALAISSTLPSNSMTALLTGVDFVASAAACLGDLNAACIELLDKVGVARRSRPQPTKGVDS